MASNGKMVLLLTDGGIVATANSNSWNRLVEIAIPELCGGASEKETPHLHGDIAYSYSYGVVPLARIGDTYELVVCRVPRTRRWKKGQTRIILRKNEDSITHPCHWCGLKSDASYQIASPNSNVCASQKLII